MIILFYVFLCLAVGEGSGGSSDDQTYKEIGKVEMEIDLSMELSGSADEISKYVFPCFYSLR